MKKLFTIIAVFLLGTAGFAQTLSSVRVQPITADYDAATPTVTFEVTWPDDRNDNRRSKVWLLVDYRRIQNNAYVDGWLRAGITVPAEAITATAGTVSREDGNTSGFWLQGTESAFTATVTVPVTVDLEGYAREFGWCGWAIDGPPTAKEAAGYYSLHGTPPFIIQTHPADAGQTVTTSSKEYTGCIYALTDTTRCPGEPPAMPAITDFAPSTTAICVGESITLTATATNAEQYSFDNGVTWGNSASTVVSPLTTTDYILQVRSTGGCTVTSANTITVNVPAIESFAASTTTICAGESVTLTATATGAEEYSFDNGGTWGNSASTVVSPLTTTDYILQVRSAGGCTVTSPMTITVTVHDLPAITLASGNDSQTIAYGDAVTPIKYYTANATGATAAGLPDGVSGSWSSDVYTISGTPTCNGIFNYTVTTTNSNGCANVTATGTITVASSEPPDAVGSSWFVCGTQTWSGPLRNPAGCSHETSLYAVNPPPAQYYDRGSSYGYYYTWTCVNTYATTLCPSPWRVPTSSDFSTLIACASSGAYHGCGAAMRTAFGTHGYVLGNGLYNTQLGYFWSNNELSNSSAYVLRFDDGSAVVQGTTKRTGSQVWCVR